MIKKLLATAILLIVIQAHSQFLEGFEGTTLPDPVTGVWALGSGNWHISTNGNGNSQMWNVNTGVATPALVYQGERSAYVNRENVGMSNVEEDWLVTPAITVSPNAAVTFYTRTTITGDQGTDYQVLVSTTSQTDHASFVPIAISTENDLSDTFNIYEQKAVSLGAFAGQNIFIAFVRRYLQPSAALGGDRWLIDNVSIAEGFPFTNAPINNIHGSAGFDMDGDGCGAGDAINYLRITANNGTYMYYKYSSNGMYDMAVSGANFIVTPGNYNAAIFDATPASYTFNFTGSGNSATADFCLTPNGNLVHDVSIELIPQGIPPRPGFDCEYLIIVRNLGHLPENGTVNFTFDDAILDVVSATQAPTLGAGLASWTFTDLSQFSAKHFSIKLNLNSPTETPPVTIGQQLESAASVTIPADIAMGNNTVALKQTVIGSWDPNDKSVNEGATISPDQTDDYLHYVIRFQNTGTAAAEFVRITDDLSSNLDVSTMEIISSSHDMRLSLMGNKAEFLFENINLPPTISDEPGSHGYVAYKIKPSASVGLGSAISNTAKIYFDYNFPIITNTVTTTVTALGIDNFNLPANIALYPNPANHGFTISVSDTISVRSVVVLNMLGQAVKIIPASGNQVIGDISDLQNGTYFVHIITDKGKAIKKLIKL